MELTVDLTDEQVAKMNVYQKLNLLRQCFAAAKLKKSGWNDFGKWHYWTLEDIVTPFEDLCSALGLALTIEFVDGRIPTGRLVNTDEPSQEIVFSTPAIDVSPMKGSTLYQSAASLLTYSRRNVFIAVLDAVEPIEDSLEPDDGAPTPKKKVVDVYSPMTSTQRKSIVDGLKRLKAQGSDPDWIKSIASTIKDNSSISQTDAESLLIQIASKLEGGER